MFFAPSKQCDPSPFLSHTTNTTILYASGFILVFEFGVHTGNQMMMMVINASLLDPYPLTLSPVCVCCVVVMRWCGVWPRPRKMW